MPQETEDERRRRKVDEQKEIFYEATKQWLDEKFAQFGRWTFYGIGAFIMVLILRGLFTLHISDLRHILEQTAEVQHVLVK